MRAVWYIVGQWLVVLAVGQNGGLNRETRSGVVESGVVGARHKTVPLVLPVYVLYLSIFAQAQARHH